MKANKSLKHHSKKRKSGKKNTRKILRRSRYRKRGGSEETCSLCHKIVVNGKSFIPSGCLMKHGKFRAHKICNDCWWDTFAQEGKSHKCPGCESGQSLNKPKPIVSKVEVIDLTTDD